MLFIEYSGCELVAWDGPGLYAASDTGWCSRLLPDRLDVVGGRSTRTFRNHLLEARGDLLLVGRTVPDDVASGLTIGGMWNWSSGRFVRRISDGWMHPAAHVDLTALPPGSNPYFGPPEANIDRRFDHAVLWDDRHVLLANRLEALLFDLTSADHVTAPFALDVGRGPRRLGGPNDRGVVQVLAGPGGGFLAVMEGGTIARLTLAGGEAVLRPTPVMRNDWAVWGCQVAGDRVLYVRRAGKATLVDRVNNAELCGLPIGRRAVTLHPDGSTIALADGDWLALRRADSPKAAQRFTISGGEVRHVAFAPDGLTMAVANAQGVTLFDVG